MVTYRDFLISYDLTLQYGTRLTFSLNHMSVYILEFLNRQKVFVTADGVYIKYFGSRLILEPRDSPSGTPEGLILPRLLEMRTSEKGELCTVDYLPRPDMKESKLNSLPVSETDRGEWSKFFRFSDSISFRTGREATEYADGICKAMLDLTQGFLDTYSKHNKVITLLIK